MIAAMKAAATRNAKAKLTRATATAAAKRLVVKQKQGVLAAAKAAYDRTCKVNATAVECTALQAKVDAANTAVSGAETEVKAADAEVAASTAEVAKAEASEKEAGPSMPEEYSVVGLAVGMSVLVLFLVAVGVAVGVIYCNRGPASTQSLNESLNANRPGLGSNYAMLGAVVSLCLALLFAIVIPASTTLYTMSSPRGSGSYGIGIWTTVTCTDVPGNGEFCMDSATADMWEGIDNDCGKALVMKLKTCQAFSVLGALAVFAAITLLFAPVPWLVPAAAATFASFSYLVLFAVAASIYHGKSNIPDANCGMDGPNNDDLNYGGSFGLAVTNWIICFAAAVLIVVGAVMFQDAAPAGRSARAQGGRPTGSTSALAPAYSRGGDNKPAASADNEAFEAKDGC